MKRTCWFIINVFSLFFAFQAHSYDKDTDLVFTFSPSQTSANLQAFMNTDESDQISSFQANQFHDNTLSTLEHHSSQSFYQYQQLRNSVLSRCIPTSCNGKNFMMTPEDVRLIILICKDNPHYDHKKLAALLAQNSVFNYAQQFLKSDSQLGDFKSDIFIDPAHFKSVANSKFRIDQVKKQAQRAMNSRHKFEMDNIKSRHKVEAKTAKKISKPEQTKVESRHKQELAALQQKQKQENKNHLGVKKREPQSKVIQPKNNPQISNISPQIIQALQSNNKPVATTYRTTNDSTLQGVMNRREQAFQESLTHPNVTTQQIKINPKTMGFLQAQNIDTAQFQQIDGLHIQHQLTHELVDILDTVADYASSHSHEIYKKNLTDYCANLANLSQQSNIQGALPEAINGTNCCHGLQHYLSGMAGSIAQRYNQIQTAMDYFDIVIDSYGDAILQHAAQGFAITTGIEAIVAAGMVAAPTVTVAATTCMIAATAVTVAPICAQALLDASSFGSACIVGNWDKVTKDLDSFSNFLQKPETVGRFAELAAGVATPTPNLNHMVDQILSLRPVITAVHKASDQVTQSLYVMTKSQLQKVWQQSTELLQRPEFTNFNASYKNILGCNFFDILPKSHPTLAPVFTGLTENMMSSSESAGLSQLFFSKNSSAANAVKATVTKISSDNILISRMTGSLRKRIFSLVRQGFELENLSYEELELIAQVIRRKTPRNVDLSNINVEFSKNSNHIFDDREGHRPDSPEFRALVINSVKSIKNHLGQDMWNTDSFGVILDDGTQLWAQVRGSIIINCGINEIPKPWNPITGFSKLTLPKKK